MKRKTVIVLGLLILSLVVGRTVLWFLHCCYYPPILMYHSVGVKRTDTPSISLASFKYQLDFLKRHKYKVIPLEKLVSMLKKRHIPRKIVVITFDDGYKDNLEAVKLLNKYNYPAVIFVISSYVGKKGYLSQSDLHWIVSSGRVEIGSHTFSHAYLPLAKDLKKEIFISKRDLERILMSNVSTFSYPIGGFNKHIESLVKEAGYVCAVTTNRGYSKNIDIYALRRIKVKDTDKGFGFYFKISGYYDFFRRLKRPE